MFVRPPAEDEDKFQLPSGDCTPSPRWRVAPRPPPAGAVAFPATARRCRPTPPALARPAPDRLSRPCRMCPTGCGGFCRTRPVLGCNKSQRSEEHTSELQSRLHLVCRLLLEKKKKT